MGWVRPGRPNISVVIPARNEEACIRQTVQAIKKAFANAELSIEIIVIDDHSTDLTSIEAFAAGASVFKNADEPGYGHAVNFGLDLALGDWVVVMVADGSDKPHDLRRMWNMASHELDAVFGHRFFAPGLVKDYPPLKLRANRLGNWLLAKVCGTEYTDITNPFKLYRNDDKFYQQVLACKARDFSMGAELAGRFIKSGRAFTYIDNEWDNRTEGKSKFRLKHVLGYLRVAWRLWRAR